MKKKTSAKKEAAQKSAAEDEQVDFETALSHLEQVVNDLEAGRLGLSDSLAQYEKGVKYLRHCYELLENAEKKIGLLSGVDANGQPEIESFDDPGSTSLEEKAELQGPTSDPCERCQAD